MRLRLVIPGSIDQATGGYRYAKRILGAWGDGPLPIVDGEPASCLARRRAGETLLIDGLALPALYDRLPLPDCAALIHHPLGLETGLAPARCWRRRPQHSAKSRGSSPPANPRGAI